MLSDVALADFVGIADEPIVQELRSLAIEQLRPERWDAFVSTSRRLREL